MFNNIVNLFFPSTSQTQLWMPAQVLIQWTNPIQIMRKLSKRHLHQNWMLVLEKTLSNTRTHTYLHCTYRYLFNLYLLIFDHWFFSIFSLDDDECNVCVCPRVWMCVCVCAHLLLFIIADFYSKPSPSSSSSIIINLLLSCILYTTNK